MRNLGMFAVWAAVTLFVTGLTWQIVSAAESQVSDGPLTQQLAGEPSTSSTNSSTDSSTASTSDGDFSTTTSIFGQSTSSLTSNSSTSLTSNSSTTSATGSTTTLGTVTTDNGGTIPSTTVPGTVTTTTTPGDGSTTTVPGGGSSTTTTQPGSTTTTTPPSNEEWTLRSIPTIGGTVIVKYRTGEVALVSATPAPGFRVEIDEPGPPEVRVDLTALGIVTVEIRVKWGSAGLEVEVREDRD